jgi:hypothetical protein
VSGTFPASVAQFSLGYSRARAKRVSLVCASVRRAPTPNRLSFESRDGSRGPAGTRGCVLSGVVPGPPSREHLRMRDERRLSAEPSLRARRYLSASRFSAARRTRRCHCGRGRGRGIRRRARYAGRIDSAATDGRRKWRRRSRRLFGPRKLWLEWGGERRGDFGILTRARVQRRRGMQHVEVREGKLLCSSRVRRLSALWWRWSVSDDCQCTVYGSTADKYPEGQAFLWTSADTTWRPLVGADLNFKLILAH